MSDKIVNQIRALFAKTGENGATEAEAQLAIDMAQRLMNRYHLTEEDLAHEPSDDYAKVDNADYRKFACVLGKKIFRWESDLAQFVSRFTSVLGYIDNEIIAKRVNGFIQMDQNGNVIQGKSFVFYGIAEEVMLASQLLDELRGLIGSMAIARFGSIYKGDGAAYAQGFVYGLFQKITNSKLLEKSAETNSTGLVLIARRDDLIQYKAKKSEEWLEEENPDLKLKKLARKQGTKTGSADAWNQGTVDGKNTEVGVSRNKKLT